MKIRLKDGSELEVQENASAYEAARTISEGLARRVTVAEINGEVKDLRTELKENDELVLLTIDDHEGFKAFNHTASHILAHAVLRLYPDAKLAIGPSTDMGFYYDIDRDERFTAEDLEKIEAEMKKIVKEKLPLERITRTREEALQKFRETGDIYKEEIVEELPEDAEISFYVQGDFEDLCSGPHLMTTGPVKAIKLLQVSGAYWRGSEDNKMLQRIYGVAFEKNKDLNAHLEALEEARKRDHNKLGRELKYFTTVDYIGQGLPILLPKGSKVIQILSRFVEDEEERRGYRYMRTPHLAKSDLYRISGHWGHYRDSMFIIGDVDDEGNSPTGDEILALRPMTCPFHFQDYLTETRSYRDLPIRYNETSSLYRNESSGEMHGLIRLRQFTISEGHIVVREDQIKDEFMDALDLARYMLRAVGLEEDVTYRFSLWDPQNKDKYIGDQESWENVQQLLGDILDETDLEYTRAEGEAAFYGPKLDIQLKNVFGKEDTLITIQIDFQLAERFGMLYTDQDGERIHPTIIHRTSIGCYERTLALLIEKYAGALPLWLAPEQVRFIPIADRHQEAANEAAKKLRAAGIRVEVDRREEKVGRKIRDAQVEQIPYMIVMGDKEVESGEFSLRHRRDGDMGTVTGDALLERLLSEIEDLRTDR